MVRMTEAVDPQNYFTDTRRTIIALHTACHASTCLRNEQHLQSIIVVKGMMYPFCVWIRHFAVGQSFVFNAYFAQFPHGKPSVIKSCSWGA